MDCLVLDQSYRPLARTTWKRALRLVLLEKAEVIESYENEWLRSTTYQIQVPSIIRLLKKILGGRKLVKFSRENVYTRDSGTCQYCSKRVPRQEATYDHVLPRALGGVTTWNNVVICCVACNQRKGGRTPEQAGMALLSKPYKPKNLPDTWRFTFRVDKNTPASWLNYLRDVVYWQGELKNE